MHGTIDHSHGYMEVAVNNSFKQYPQEIQKKKRARSRNLKSANNSTASISGQIRMKKTRSDMHACV